MHPTSSTRSRYRLGRLEDESQDNLLRSTPIFDDGSSDITTHIPPRSEASIELETIHPYRAEPGVGYSTATSQEAPKGVRSKYLPLSSTELDRVGGERPPSGATTPHSTGYARSFWTPYALRWPFLALTLFVSVVLALVVVLLLAYSSIRHGLGSDNGTSAVLFGWRFSPTLVTVLYAVLTSMVLKDAQKTESFSQMSHPAGAASKSSVFRKDDFWWNVLAQSMRKTENHGKINYFIMATILVHTINTLLINTLSSSLLQSQDVGLQSQVSFDRYQTTGEHPIAMAADNLVYFQTISNILQNLTISPWLTEKYAVVPFGPSSAPPDQSLLPTTGIQQWNSTTTVLSVELECNPMKIQYAEWSKNFTGSKSNPTSFDSFLLTDSQGCEVGLNFQGNPYLLYYGGGSWFAPPNFTDTLWDSSAGDDAQYHNSTAGCGGRQVIFATNSSSTAPNVTRALSCQSAFYSAEMNAVLSMNASTTTVDVDEGVFNTRRTLMPRNSVLDQVRFETAFMDSNWSSMLFTSDRTTRNFGGPSALLAATYNFDPIGFIESDTLTRNAQKIKQRFLGEMVLASVGKNTQISQAGQITNIERRVVVNIPIAISLIALLSVSTGLMSIVLYTSRKRLLNVYTDPTSVAATVRLIDGNSTLYAALHVQDRHGRHSLNSALELLTYHVMDGRLHTERRSTEPASQSPSDAGTNGDWRPFVVRRSASLFLALFLVLVFAATLSLFIVAKTIGLYATAFTYEAALSNADNGLFEFVPFSIVPTFIAVIIGVWWTSFDEAFQRLQSFIPMAETPVALQPTIGLSYAAMTPIDSIVRAFKNRRWTIVMVSFAAILTQVLTVSMSALWQRTGGARHGTVDLTRSLEPRALPFEYNFMQSTSPAGGTSVGQIVLSDLYGHLSQNWLYSATLQLVYNGSEPGWSTDGWSFVPVDMSPIIQSAVYKSTPANASVASASSVRTKNVNVTLVTPALRGTLDCTPIPSTSNMSSWLTSQDLTNSSIWNVTQNPIDWEQGFEINKILELGAEALFSSTPILSQDRGAPICCANTSSTSEGASAIGYWSNNHRAGLSYDFQSSVGAYPRNFTIKWIVGDARPRHYLMNETWSQYNSIDSNEDSVHLIWPTAPQMSALNCRPRIQWTNASVTVDMATSKVHHYTIVDPLATFDWPWADVYAVHNDTTSPDLLATQITVSSGVLFQDAMMVAADLRALWEGIGNYASWPEDLDDTTFNMRIPQQGLNTDLMSYSMYQLTGGNLSALTDHEHMTRLGDKVFSTFFQHFASYNTSAGGWVMQNIGATLSPNLGPIISDGYETDPIVQDQNVTFTSDTRVTAKVAIAVEVLEMSPLAVYITLSILLVLVLVTGSAYVMGFRHVGILKHDLDDLASVLGVVYASEKLQRWVRAHPEPEQWKRKPASGQDVPQVHLGSFAAGSDERETWGIEIVEDSKEPRRPEGGNEARTGVS